MELRFIKTILQIVFWMWSQRKRCSKRTLCISARSAFQKFWLKKKTSSKKNIFWQRSEIAQKLAWKRSIMNLFYCVCLKRITLCSYLCFSSSPFSCFSASLIWNIGEFGATNYFTDHWTNNTIACSSLTITKGKENTCSPWTSC